MLHALAPGDVVTVTRIDRLARSTFDLFAIVKQIVDAKAQFRSLAEPWADTGASTGRLMIAVLGGLADVERDLIRTHTAEGRSRAQKRGAAHGPAGETDARAEGRGQPATGARRDACRTCPQLPRGKEYDFACDGVMKQESEVRSGQMVDLTLFEKINADLKTLEIDEIKSQLEHFIKGMVVRSPIFDPGGFLYRARRIGTTFNKTIGMKYADLIYPPKGVTKLGRLNREGDPVFYCSVHKESIFFELPDLSPGDEIILTFWKTTDRMIVNNIGYTQPVFESLGAKRPLPQWVTSAPDSKAGAARLPTMSQQEIEETLSRDTNGELRRVFSEYFMCSVEDKESHKYKLTTALGELHLVF